MQKEYLTRREKIATNKIFNQEWILAASWWMESILTQDEHEFEIEKRDEEERMSWIWSTLTAWIPILTTILTITNPNNQDKANGYGYGYSVTHSIMCNTFYLHRSSEVADACSTKNEVLEGSDCTFYYPNLKNKKKKRKRENKT